MACTALGTCLAGAGGSIGRVEAESAAAEAKQPRQSKAHAHYADMPECACYAGMPDAPGSVGPACTGRGRRGRGRAGAAVRGSVNVRRLMRGKGHGEAPAAVEGLGRGLWGGRGKSRDGEAVPIEGKRGRFLTCPIFHNKIKQKVRRFGARNIVGCMCQGDGRPMS
ncbi:hypothetical protein [Anaerobacterium chartisolvens]|uniref:hypothetical protein n=1 Tax=Anaerobacterium chartisolvens TaxID=1297424 RepID=UPI000DF3454B|nr:hypothetical protein [Anaerobacterium chartisolvens]